ncbi:MAG: nickel pincer cofactor biosynthesis protein LarC [Nitrospiraceae bacterium]|nr:MAG: nickel pincer cofactor biosynthesis protein LarC [Nitrospiraceae bacterium]
MIAYFDCFSGVSGDMILGSLIDAGLSLDDLSTRLKTLPVTGYALRVRKVRKAGIRASKFDVIISGSSPSRKWKDIERIIDSSGLSPSLRKKGLDVFKRLFKVEAKVHGSRYDKVHLHELSAVDCIVDIMGTLTGLDMMGIEDVYCSAINLGNGTIKTAHGILPVPAPATAELLKGIPVYSSETTFELTTPTGAVLMSSLASGFGKIPDMSIEKIGTGAGGKNFKTHPNVLRVLIGHRTKKTSQGNLSDGHGSVTVIETNIDDMNPQVYDYILDRLFKAGALDVHLTQVIMKKGRPGIVLTTICSDDRKEDLIHIILTETTSIGLRFYHAARKTLQRESKTVTTKWGRIRVKKSWQGNDIRKLSPEYEDCRKIAAKYNIPLIDVLKSIK